MFKNFFKRANDEDIFETVDPIVEQRRNEKFSKPLIYDEEFKKEQEANKKKVEASKKEKAKEVPKKNIKQTAPKVEEPISKKGYEMIDIISPIFGMKEEKIETEKVTKKVETTTKKAKKAVKKSSEKATKAKSKSKGKSTAKKYIGKNMDELVAAIGKYKSMDKDKSCLEEGEYDGFFYYDGFTVSATTKNGQWIINSVD